MSENKEHPEEEFNPPTTSSHDAQNADGPTAKPESQRIVEDFIAELKRQHPDTKLPADEREQILANLPPPEEREREYRELQKNGGLSSEEFFASLAIELEQQP